MNQHPIIRVLKKDTRYKLEAYEFVREALTYAQDKMGLGVPERAESGDIVERHLTGQQLCEAGRLYALEQYGMLAKLVLNSWGIYATGDLGEIVYNLIDAKLMKKSASDRREDFDDVFDFTAALEADFEITVPKET